MPLPALLLPAASFAARVAFRHVLRGRFASAAARNAQASAMRARRISRLKRGTYLTPLHKIREFWDLPNQLPLPSFKQALPDRWAYVGSPWNNWSVASGYCSNPTYTGSLVLITQSTAVNSSGLISSANNCSKPLAFSGDYPPPNTASGAWSNVNGSSRTVLFGRTRLLPTLRAEAQHTFSRSTAGSWAISPRFRAARVNSIPFHVAGVIPPVYPMQRPSLYQYFPQLMPVGQWLPSPANPTFRQAQAMRNASPWVLDMTFSLPKPENPARVDVLARSSTHPVAGRSHWRRPPTGSEREKKFRISAPMKLVLDTFGKADEVWQAARVLYDLIPDNQKPRHPEYSNYHWKKPTMDVMLKAIYENFSDIDMDEFGKRYLTGQLLDAAIGQAHGTVDRGRWNAMRQATYRRSN